MMLPINPKLQMVVDLRDCSEIWGAEAVDLETGEVTVREITYAGEVRRTISVPSGVRLVRRGR